MEGWGNLFRGHRKSRKEGGLDGMIVWDGMMLSDYLPGNSVSQGRIVNGDAAHDWIIQKKSFFFIQTSIRVVIYLLAGWKQSWHKLFLLFHSQHKIHLLHS